MTSTQPTKSRRNYTAPEPASKFIRPCSWSAHNPATHYTSWLLTELGRVGLEMDDLRNEQRQVLSDILQWLSDQPSANYAKLVDWRRLNQARITARDKSKFDPALPRIELRADVNVKWNLCVRWHPLEFRPGETRDPYHPADQIPGAGWGVPIDFIWFEDLESYAGRRPTSELLWIRGVGELRPGKSDYICHQTGINLDVVDGILICAVRAVYEGLIRSLRRSFYVTVSSHFEFQQDEQTIAKPSGHATVRRVVGWKLEYSPPTPE